MTELVIKWRWLAIVVASATVAGCSIFDDNAESQWRQVAVLHVQPRAELSSIVNVRCVGPAVVGPNVVVVVKYRVARAPHLQAFAIPAGRSLHVGDPVLVNPSQCLIADNPREP